MPVDMEKIHEQMNSLLQLYSRLDANLSNIVRDFNAIEKKLDELADGYSVLKTDIEIIKQDKSAAGHSNKIAALESQATKLKDEIHALQIEIIPLRIETKANSSNWGRVVDIGYKIVMAVVSGYLLFKLGLPTK